MHDLVCFAFMIGALVVCMDKCTAISWQQLETLSPDSLPERLFCNFPLTIQHIAPDEMPGCHILLHNGFVLPVAWSHLFQYFLL